jgi:hypothetical protein
VLGLGFGFTSPAVLGGSGAAAAVGGAALLVGETNGFATKFTYAVDGQRVAVKVAGVVTESALDAFYTVAGTSPKLVFDASGTLVWTPHNMYLQSAVPATRAVAIIPGETYTVTVTGSGSLTGSAGASGVATQASPLIFVATTSSGTFTLAGSLTQVQMNRGSVATAYLATTAAQRFGVAVDYDPVSPFPARGLLVETAATNLLVNNLALSTQSVTVTAVAHTLSFWGTGTVTLSGVSTAGPLVGTGVNNRVSLTFTPTAGSLTLTVSGTVTRGQLETGTAASSPVPTFSVTATRAADNISSLLSAIPTLGTEYSLYARFSMPIINNNQYIFVVSDGSGSNFATLKALDTGKLTVFVAGAAQATIVMGTTVANVVAAAAARIKQNDFAVSQNSAAVAVDTLGNLPAITKLSFGGVIATAAIFRIEEVSIVPRGWTDVELPVKSTL